MPPNCEGNTFRRRGPDTVAIVARPLWPVEHVQETPHTCHLASPLRQIAWYNASAVPIADGGVNVR